jgi:hypothetical protein
VNSAHLDYEALADLAEGLLDDDLAASAAEHLADCGECRERSAELADVSRLLAETPVPPMPAELAARIDAALAAESVSTATVTSLQARRGQRNLRMLSAAAAAIVVVGGGVMVTRSVMDSSVGGGSSNAVTTQPVQEHTRSPGKSPTTLTAPRTAPNGSTDQYSITESGTDYRDGTLGAQVAAKLRQGEVSASRTDERLAGCVDALAEGRRPLLVDAAAYDGRPATIIAIQGAAQGQMDVWVVGSGCSAASRDVIKHVQMSR